MKYKISTEIFKNGIIEQKLQTEEDGHFETLKRWIMDTKETCIREALVRLGWTPPK